MGVTHVAVEENHRETFLSHPRGSPELKIIVALSKPAVSRQSASSALRKGKYLT